MADDLRFKIKQNDNRPTLKLRNRFDTNLAPYSLVGDETVEFKMRDLADPTIKTLTGTARIFSASEGIVEYEFTFADTSEIGIWEAEFKVTDTSGNKVTFPTEQKLYVEVFDDIS